jgi:hypothetical protein
MKIDRPHVPVSTLEPTNNKVLVRLCATDIGKSKKKILLLVTLARQIFHIEWLLRRLWTK